MEKLLYEKSRPNRIAHKIPQPDVKMANLQSSLPSKFLRKDLCKLPELSELEVVRHFVNLSQNNFSIDTGFYPLGSCTMKYNPKINDELARLDGFVNLHPYQPESQVQGALELMWHLQEYIKEIVGMDAVTLQPAAGAHGELTGLLVIKAFFEHKQDKKRKVVIVPDTAHGTNPATASLCSFDVVEIKSNEYGMVDIDSLKAVLNENVAAIMLTNPNTLGLFEEEINHIQSLVHQVGGLLYYDGANLNAIMGLVRPGDTGFDVCHLNLHKTFSTPHGGGGPGGCAVAVREHLASFLPKPMVKMDNGRYYLDYDMPQSIGKVKGYYGNFGILVRAYAYMLAYGGAGLTQVSRDAILNANYLKTLVRQYFDLAYDKTCMHEFVVSASKQKELGVNASQIAKRLLDFKVHSPTMYFPLVVHEALMIEPTETESKETLDSFAQILAKVNEEINTNPELVRSAPHNTPVAKIDEAMAARKLNLCYKD